MAMMLVLSVSFANAQLKINDTFPNVQLLNNQNSLTQLHSFKGKIVLVDFWASWCAPCRLTNKKLVVMYNKYKSKNFEIVGISIDTDKAKWLKAIEKDKLKHTQLIDPKGFDAQSAILFGAETLPASYLFDTSGKLVAINPTEAQIIAQLKK
ncbi:thioredoxin [Flavobacterium kingsejongi]|uniref:Thioredoxin n=2 Tax=Flavobacterium kingsejongi TaxID=1678728 RepID=A0A2S1LQ52_9FLAO|nr:thioredoxin [Flavobacterium kingsejongi]